MDYCGTSASRFAIKNSLYSTGGQNIHFALIKTMTLVKAAKNGVCVLYVISNRDFIKFVSNHQEIDKTCRYFINVHFLIQLFILKEKDIDSDNNAYII